MLAGLLMRLGLGQVHSVGDVLDDEILAKPEIQEAIRTGGNASLDLEIVNVDRSTLGRLGGAIAKQYGDKGFPGSIDINFTVRPGRERASPCCCGGACSGPKSLAQVFIASWSFHCVFLFGMAELKNGVAKIRLMKVVLL